MARSILQYGFDLDTEGFVDAAANESWGDGLPFAPFDDVTFGTALSTLRTEATSLVGDMPITMEELCAVSLLAGCEPTYIPAVLAAVLAVDDKRREAGSSIVLDPETSHAVMVNGPARYSLGINFGLGLMGPGFPANATIGRALQLTLRYCGMGRARGFGDPSQYALAFAEDEQDDWIPYHVERGFEPDESTVSVITYSKGGRSFDRTSTSTPECFDRLAIFLRDHASATDWFGETPLSIFVAVGQEWRRQFTAAGHSKNDVRHEIYRRVMDPDLPGRTPRLGDQEALSIVGCGGPADASIWFFVGTAGLPAIRKIGLA